MTVSEFTFLALGLVLGLASGIALVEIIRARPPARGEVRVTVAQDAIPRRRPATLSDDAFVAVGPEPARGGPADRREIDLPLAPSDADRRTHVQSGVPSPTAGPQPGDHLPGSGGSPGVAVPIVPDTGPVFRIQGLDPSRPSGPRAKLVGFTVTPGEDPVLAALRTSIVAAAAEADPASAPVRRQTAVAVLEPEPPSMAAPPAAPSRPPDATSGPAATERCAEERRIADERCELATRARARAEEAASALRVAHRAYDAHETSAEEAAGRADPRAVRTAKEEAQRAFRAASRTASNAEAVEGAARDWLHEINRINAEAREAVAAATRERAAVAVVGATVERLSLEADAARIGADTAETACVAARSALAECDERQAMDPDAFLLPALPPLPEADRPDADEVLGIAIEAGATPRIFRLLQGDRTAMTTLVGALAAGDPEQAAHWHELMTRLVDAILADTIESSALEFPTDHPFWGPFSLSQGRDIVQALSSLGYRFDGRGGWMDDRIPAQRDLSLAVGYAGLDPMRVRHWPNEAASRVLFSEVHVAADEYLATNAG
ncbi:MAG: hypothetical protein ACXWXA_11130, partial [Candidatus Limnocylindrales bacterium]